VLDNHMIPANRTAFPTWVAFLDAFLAQVSLQSSFLQCS